MGMSLWVLALQTSRVANRVDHLPLWFWVSAALLLGAFVGSFLNVVVWRVPRGIGLVKPDSFCPRCEHKLAWYDNLPVIGWLLLLGIFWGILREASGALWPSMVAHGVFNTIQICIFLVNSGDC